MPRRIYLSVHQALLIDYLLLSEFMQWARLQVKTLHASRK